MFVFFIYFCKYVENNALLFIIFSFFYSSKRFPKGLHIFRSAEVSEGFEETMNCFGNYIPSFIVRSLYISVPLILVPLIFVIIWNNDDVIALSMYHTHISMYHMYHKYHTLWYVHPARNFNLGRKILGMQNTWDAKIFPAKNPGIRNT